MAAETPTFRTLVAVFTDFLTVAIHTILYERAIYPQTSFISAWKYNFSVRQNRHPKVCEWVNDAIGAVEAELLKGMVERVVVVIINGEGSKALERFVFDVSRFPVVPVADADTPLKRTGPNREEIPVLPKVDMEEQFRATMSKLANCSARLKPLPEGCTFTVAIELKADGLPPIGHPQQWMPAQPKLPHDGTNDDQIATTVPLRTVVAGDMVFESWYEESNATE